MTERIGVIPTIKSNERTTPAPHRKCMKASLELNQQSVGRIQNARPPSCWCAAGRKSPTGETPLVPINPSTWTQRETNAIRYTTPSARRNQRREAKYVGGRTSLPQSSRVIDEPNPRLRATIL